MKKPTLPKASRARVVIERVSPEIDGGRFPVKRIVGEEVIVEADVFVDGHDQLSCLLLHRPVGAKIWDEVPMIATNNDRWRASFFAAALGRHEYTVLAWVDRFLTWRHDLARRKEAEDIVVALQIGTALLDAAAKLAGGDDGRHLKDQAAKLRAAATPEVGQAMAQDESLAILMAKHGERLFVSEYDRVLEVVVDTKRARFSAWYELFPRSCRTGVAAHGSFADVIKRLPQIAAMGFDVLYLPPIHPIGRTFRKGPNNSLTASPDDLGSPWAIGAAEGGHREILTELGTAKDFRQLVTEARALGLEVALDIAFQCAPDHPYVTQHPEWFRHRPDGSIQYAENPPKKYQDIYPFDFESENCDALWLELKGVVDHWIGEGVRIFRVDNPHTKPFPFWEWLINSIKVKYPETIFLAEAFTRPKIMHRLAKLGFTQSYTYFTWRNTQQELTEYFTELAQHDSREYFRPNLWPNTPDILPEFLQHGGRPAFLLRVALAATLGANYGIYGPAYELLEHTALKPGGEEYLDSEKFQIRNWELDRPDNLRDFISRLNHIRRNNPALQSDWSLRFHAIDNPVMLCYSKTDDDVTMVMVANLDPHNVQSGWIELPLTELGMPEDSPYQAHDLLTDERYLWQGTRNFVSLNPHASPVHILLLRRYLRSERDFDYFL
ncbi:alpha-1,4-glucan--maltose-1-phosphate maltosyltransferase [Candidatus Nitrotoga sp. M5]|uniref:alpha-1,4-glucan--maltose-1-phosphate maltosyltransferase n=1 Tax=Candidatus Nitrotoga sp. M5 TaxID=2890409 RepID=UPI001EF608BD|nr:alpha-1,4-glucan--maltose-1-phosphate maltosyltransferase [Candidatus Nitrotoga sp. M5]CAH1387838.1 Alpha-1,4-glucan:maltose-1-phosphate maltosyltransferase [Candidatus Nitrotoga sp. M5]